MGSHPPCPDKAYLEDTPILIVANFSVKPSALRSQKFYNDQMLVLVDFLLCVTGLRRSESVVLRAMAVTLHERMGHSGPKWLTNYLKACVRICMFFLSGRDHRALNEGEVFVRRGRDGLPFIIPPVVRRHFVNLRATGSKESLRVVRVCLSILCFYRVLAVGSKVDLSTITDPFNGQYTTFSSEELDRATSMLPDFTLSAGR